MTQYEYRVITAPTRGVKAKGIKTPEDRFSHALEETMNQYAAQGWEYLRAETLPSVERAGLTSSTTNWRNVLVFRRALKEPAVDAVVTPVAALPEPEVPMRKEPVIVAPQTPDDDASQSEGATRMLTDNGVEEPSDVAGMTNSLKQLASSRKADKSDD